MIKITIKQTTMYKFNFKLHLLCDRYYVALWEQRWISHSPCAHEAHKPLGKGAHVCAYFIQCYLSQSKKGHVITLGWLLTLWFRLRGLNQAVNQKMTFFWVNHRSLCDFWHMTEPSDTAVSQQDSLAFTFIKMNKRNKIDAEPIFSLALSTIHPNTWKLSEGKAAIYVIKIGIPSKNFNFMFNNLWKTYLRYFHPFYRNSHHNILI